MVITKMELKKCLICGKEFKSYKNPKRPDRGKYCSRLCFGKSKKDENHYAWKGAVSYRQLHRWIAKNKPKVELCEICHKRKPYDIANISGTYKHDINDYRWLCRKCHIISDGRIYNLNVKKEIN